MGALLHLSLPLRFTARGLEPGADPGPQNSPQFLFDARNVSISGVLFGTHTSFTHTHNSSKIRGGSRAPKSRVFLLMRATFQSLSFFFGTHTPYTHTHSSSKIRGGSRAPRFSRNSFDARNVSISDVIFWHAYCFHTHAQFIENHRVVPFIPIKTFENKIFSCLCSLQAEQSALHRQPDVRAHRGVPRRRDVTRHVLQRQRRAAVPAPPGGGGEMKVAPACSSLFRLSSGCWSECEALDFET